MLSDTLQNALNNQIAEEAYASDYYLSMASWCEVKGLPGAASFLYAQAAFLIIAGLLLDRYSIKNLIL